MTTQKKQDYVLSGKNRKALFTLKVYRGDGMVLLAMNWKNGRPPKDFVGFSIEYKEPDGDRFYSLKNRLSFLNKDGTVCPDTKSTLLSPIQMFRWVHFPRNAAMNGTFVYKVKPVFMNFFEELSYGEPQQVEIELHRETHKDCLDVAFTRGYVSSQSFVDKYNLDGGISTLLPKNSKSGLDFIPTHPKAKTALKWMGFDATTAIFGLLNEAIRDKTAEVKVVAYDLNQPSVLEKLEKLKDRLSIIIDDSAEHREEDSAETQAAERLQNAGAKVKRQHVGQLQHNKVIVVNGSKVKAAVCGSTNFTWRGFYVQSNNAVIVRGDSAIAPFLQAFENYWNNGSVSEFGKTDSALWNDLNIPEIDAKVSFSPHNKMNSLLDDIASDISKTKSSLFYSLAFLSQTGGSLKEKIVEILDSENVFVYGISDKKMGGLILQKPNGNAYPVYPAEISGNLPEPFKSEPTGGFGTRMHHKFVVIDFDKSTARVYLGSYNFSSTADRKNGENLLLIKDQKIAISYMIEALRIFDHYHFRVNLKQAKAARDRLYLAKPPKTDSEAAWWDKYYTDPRKIKDREMFG